MTMVLKRDRRRTVRVPTATNVLSLKWHAGTYHVGSMRRILIIDDEDDIRQVAALTLEAIAGWQVSMASSGVEGIRKAIAEQPEAILMDVMMPDMDGPSTVREMRKHKEIAHIPVLLLTAKVQGVDQRRFADLGVAAVLFKPFDPLTLAEQISEALHWDRHPACSGE